jgi:putative ABC transport system permease protein
MRSGPVTRAMRGGLTRRRVQTIVIGLVVLISTGASVLALALVVDSSAPFDHAFAAQHGADVVATFNSAKASDAQLDGTRHLAGVTASAGPFGELTVNPSVSGQGTCTQSGPCFIGGGLGPMTLVGRASPGGPVDDLTLQSGHWATKPGEVVLDSSGNGPQVGVPLGAKLTINDAPGKPALTVVGTASSITGSADGWVAPSEISALSSARNPASAQMLYTFASAGSTAAIHNDVTAVSKALPAGSVTGTESYLAAKAEESGNIGPFVPFLFAFGIIGMVMAVLIVANVVSGAVVSGYRRIGILKSIGFTPAQVLGAYTGQVIIPAVVGCVVGVALGNVIAAPVLAQTAQAYAIGALGVPAWVDVLVPVVMLGLVGVAAVLPALRATRLSAVQAIATGRAPQTGRGYAAHRLLGRLRLPRPATIGLAAPFAKPARTAVTLVAVLLGAATVTLAVGLGTSLRMVVSALSQDQAQPVQVMFGGPGPGGPVIHVKGGPKPGKNGGPPPVTSGQPSAGQAQRAITAALAAEPGTLHYVGEADQQVGVVGHSQQFNLTAYSGNSGWTGWVLVSGHWFTGPDQVEVSASFLTLTGDSIGNNIIIENGGYQVTAKIVGEVFSGDSRLISDWQTLAAIDPGVTPDQYDIGLKPGTNEAAYIQSLTNKLGPDYFVNANQRNSTVVDLMIGLIGTLTLLLAIVAGLGVLNTVVLYTRERVHDLGVFKAVGMTPRQTIAMVVCWVAGTGLVAGLIAVPVGILLHRIVLPAMASAADVGVPPSFLSVYGNWEIAVLALAGLAIAIAGALLPAGWAAGTRTATALRAE